MTASCSDKNESPETVSIQPVEVTQLMYKETDVSFPEDFSGRIGLYYNEGVHLIYSTKDNVIKIMNYDDEMNETSSVELTDGSEEYYDVYAFTKNDGTNVLMFMYADYDKDEITDYDDYFANAKIHFTIRSYSPDGELLSEIETDGLEKYFNFGDSFISGFYSYSENYIVILNDELVMLDAYGKVIENNETSENYEFGEDAEGRTIAGTWDSYAYMNGETLNYPTNTSEYGKWLNRIGPFFCGEGSYKLFLTLNEGIYGLTYSDELIQLLDFTDSNITANGIEFAAYAGEGKFVILGTDQTSMDGLFYSLLTVRPDDYVENKQTVILGYGDYDNNSTEIEAMYNKQSDNYSIETRESLIKSRLMPWYASCMYIFRHIALKLLEIRQYSCVVLVQSDEKSDYAICAPDLISDSLESIPKWMTLSLMYFREVLPT